MSDNTKTSDIWFIGDTHFGHKNILTFEKDNGHPLRQFSSVEEMDMTIINNWNSVVKPQDKVYHLGDVTFKRSAMDYFKILNGKKRLIKGNHDMFKDSVYAEHFQQVHGVKHMNVAGHKFVLSHVPIHKDCIDKWGVNIHGHLHANNIRIFNPEPHETIEEDLILDSRYINVSCEQINYTPIHIEEIFQNA